MSPGARAGAGSFVGRVWSQGPVPCHCSIRDRSGGLLPQAAVPRSEDRCASIGNGPCPVCPTSGRLPVSADGGWCSEERSGPLSSSANGLPSRRLRLGISFGIGRRSVGRSVFTFDVLRMRAGTESDKGARCDLSTLATIASGQGWISQRPGAFAGNIILRLFSKARAATYFRSRFASSRRRRALSLMKPAASFWS